MEIIVRNHVLYMDKIRPTILKNNENRQKRHIFVRICVFFSAISCHTHIVKILKHKATLSI